MTDEQTSELPCHSCGCPSGSRVHKSVRAPGPDGRMRQTPLGECDQCRDRDALADQALAPHERQLRARYGTVRPRIVRAFDALQLVGASLPSEPSERQVEDLIHHVGQFSIRYEDAAALGIQPGEPWSHVSAEQRAAVRVSVAAALKERVGRLGGPLALPPPEGLAACAYCGLGVQWMSSDHVQRLGGSSSATSSVWVVVTTSTQALGGKRTPKSVRAALCSDCWSSVVSADAVIGATSRQRALVRFAQKQGYDVDMNDGASPRGWAVLDRAPNATPWQHILRSDPMEPPRPHGRARTP